MTEDMKKWLELVSADEELRNEITPLNEVPREEAVMKLISKASERGLTLTEDDFTAPGSDELSDDELEAVAGGGGCGCPVIGGGGGIREKTDRQYGCGCVLIGCGGVDGDIHNCTCAMGGIGFDHRDDE